MTAENALWKGVARVRVGVGRRDMGRGRDRVGGEGKGAEGDAVNHSRMHRWMPEPVGSQSSETCSYSSRATLLLLDFYQGRVMKI